MFASLQFTLDAGFHAAKVHTERPRGVSSIRYRLFMYMMNLIDSRVIENVAQHVCATGKLNDKQTTTKVHGRTDRVLQLVIYIVSYTVSNDNGILLIQ